MSQPPPPPPPPEYGQPYGQGGQPYGQGQPGYGQPQSSTRAVVALVLGIVGLFFCQLFVGIAAIVVARSAVKEVDASGGRLGGRGMATAGWILGVVDIVLAVIGILVFLLLFATGNTTNG